MDHCSFLAIDKAVTQKLKDARDLLAKGAIDISSAYAREVIGSVASGAARLSLSRNLAMLPFLVLGVLKTVRRTLNMQSGFELTFPKGYLQ